MNDVTPQAQSGSRRKWLIPVGCLGAVVLCCGMPIALVSFVFGALKTSTPYQESLARVQADPAIREVLGEPIEPSFIVTGSINISGNGGDADITYDVSGPKGSATVVLDADKAAGEWTFNILEVRPAAGGQPIDLLAGEEGNEQAPPPPPADDEPAGVGATDE